MELSAAFWIRSKPPEIVRQPRYLVHGEEKGADVVWLKNGVVRIEDFEFV